MSPKEVLSLLLSDGATIVTRSGRALEFYYLSPGSERLHNITQEVNQIMGKVVGWNAGILVERLGTKIGRKLDHQHIK